ncbi:hypothetical protein HG531_008620 [Fusarium graminearum]|nr:hypothetical protein HG531_008620 [Fusarium graminearum]
MSYFNLELFNVAKIRRLAACALTLPTTLPARSGTSVASIKLASVRVFFFSAATNTFENVLVLSKHLDIIAHFPLNSTAKKLLKNNHDGSSAEPVVSLVELKYLKENVANRFDERFKFLILKGVQFSLGFGGREVLFVDIERNRVELICSRRN